MSDASFPPAGGSPSDTRERILEVAGALFADHGFRSVSLRRITREAEVNLASVNYHFGSKEALVLEVLSRVVGPINASRLAMLDEAEAEFGDEPVPVERILEALFAPVLSVMSIDSDASSEEVSASDVASVDFYLKLVGRCMSERQELMPTTLMRLYKETIDRFCEAMFRVLPGLDQADVFWRMHFTAGALLYTLTQPERLAAFSRGKVDVTNSGEVLRQLITYTAAGMKAEVAAAPVNKPVRRRKNVASTTSSMLIGLAALVSVGCAATSPDSMKAELDVELAEAYAAGEPGSGRPLADSDWISRFGDRRLDALVAEALANNKDLKIAAARLRAAEATAELAGVDRKPKLDGAFNGSRSEQNFIGFPFGAEEGGGNGNESVVSSLTNNFGLSLDLSWEIDLWGRIRTEQQGAIAAMEASQADYAGIQLSIAAQTAKTWFALIEARQQEELARRTLQLFQQTEKSIADQFANGIEEQGADRASQLRLARTDVATAEEALVQRQQSTRQVARQLETVLSRYPRAEVEAVNSLPRLPSAPPAGVPASLLDRRPDLIAAERRLAASDRKYAAARLAILPTIRLTGSGGTSSEMIENLLDQNFSVWSLAGSAVQPILSGGNIKYGVRLRKNEIVQAAGDYDKAVLTAFREVEDALDLEQFLARREALLVKAVKLADDAYGKSIQEFGEGVGDFLTLLNTQQRKVQSETQLITIRRLRLDNRVDLHLALGGDYRARKKS